jgi:hypothetical protein
MWSHRHWYSRSWSSSSHDHHHHIMIVSMIIISIIIMSIFNMVSYHIDCALVKAMVLDDCWVDTTIVCRWWWWWWWWWWEVSSFLYWNRACRYLLTFSRKWSLFLVPSWLNGREMNAVVRSDSARKCLVTSIPSEDTFSTSGRVVVLSEYRT